MLKAQMWLILGSESLWGCLHTPLHLQEDSRDEKTPYFGDKEPWPVVYSLMTRLGRIVGKGREKNAKDKGDTGSWRGYDFVNSESGHMNSKADLPEILNKDTVLKDGAGKTYYLHSLQVLR